MEEDGNTERTLTWEIDGVTTEIASVGLNEEGKVYSAGYLNDYTGHNPPFQDVLDFYGLETAEVPS